MGTHAHETLIATPFCVQRNSIWQLVCWTSRSLWSSLRLRLHLRLGLGRRRTLGNLSSDGSLLCFLFVMFVWYFLLVFCFPCFLWGSLGLRVWLHHRPCRCCFLRVRWSSCRGSWCIAISRRSRCCIAISRRSRCRTHLSIKNMAIGFTCFSSFSLFLLATGLDLSDPYF